MARRTGAGPACTIAIDELPSDRAAASREVAALLEYALSQSAERGTGWRVEPSPDDAGAVARLIEGERTLEIGLLHDRGGPPLRRYGLWVSAWVEPSRIPAPSQWAALVGGIGMTLLGLVAMLRVLELAGGGWGRVLFGALVAVAVGALTAAMIRRQVLDRTAKIATRRAARDESGRLTRVAQVIVASLRTQERVSDVQDAQRSA